MWTLNPLTAHTDERRKFQRRTGIGRRIHGERRVFPGAPLQKLPAGWIPRGNDRRVARRRVVPDRRSGS